LSKCDITLHESEQTSTWSLNTREFGKPIKEVKQMKANQEAIACATSHGQVDWHAINWRNRNQNVRRLQARIVKATQEGRWGKVKALQHLLTHSFSGKALAVRRVTENQGKNTPGVNGEIWNTPTKKAEAVLSLRQRGYQPAPLRRIYIPKSSDPKKLRPLSIPTMKDRAMQALYLLALDPTAETMADPNSYGFRNERSTADAIEQCFKVLNRKDRAEWILEGDIKSCFDRISHEWLLAHIPMDKIILKKWLEAGFIEKHVYHPTYEGTPQGGIVSPVLANMTLDGLERELRKEFTDNQRAKVNFVRYADDFIVTGGTKEVLEEKVLPLVENFLNQRGLELSKEKTRITHIKDGFDFLGQNVRKYNGKLIIKPAKKNVKAFLGKVRNIIESNATASSGNLIVRLNPVIHGWADYHQHICSKRTFNDVDNAIFKKLWLWAERRHGNKGRRWIKDKYFKSVGRRNWVFTGICEGPDEIKQTTHLRSAAYTPIKRHIKVKGNANPYDPEWETYFERRLGIRVEANLKGRQRLLNLWKSQNGLCPVCGQKITEITGWHNHHITWRSKGGTDTVDNQVLLHPNCHNKVHCQKLAVVKPRPSTGATKA
jgi:RNA-directed DNA polymerase